MPAYSIDDQLVSPWQATTLRAQGRNESYLERLIASDPLVLGLDPYLTGLGTDFVAFCQTTLQSPTVRPLRPDVVLLSATGHVVIVEVKLEDNPELRDRRVISQIVDYAAAVANLDEMALLSWLGEAGDTSWLQVIQRAFPNSHDVERLAGALADRIARADIHLVVACDVAPVGLRDTVKLISAQSALGEFQLHVVELAPHVSASEPGRLLVIPQEVARTEIVSRTAVTVRYEGETGVSVSVVASSPSEVKDAIKQVGTGRSIRAEFETLLDAYNLDPYEGLLTNGNAIGYRQIKIPNWPDAVHYEFLDRRGDPGRIGVEIHVESDQYPIVCDWLKQQVSSLNGEFPSIEYSSKWMKGCRLVVTVPSADPVVGIQTMKRLISRTRDRISELVLPHPEG